MKVSTAEIGIIGAGDTARTFAIVASRAGMRVNLWTGRSVHAVRGKPESAPLPPSVRIVKTLEEAGKDAPLIILAVPASEIRPTVRAMGGFLTGDQVVLHAAKSMEFDGEKIVRTSQIIRRESCVKKIGVLAGPFFPEEILSAQPAAMVVGSPFNEAVDAARRAFTLPTFKLFSSDDMAGVELGSAMNQAYAAAGGIGAGLGHGAVTQSFIITRGLLEMAGFGAACGARAATFSGLAGLGELMANLTQERSAAFRLGYRLAQSRKPASFAKVKTECPEIAGSIEAAVAFARRMRIPMPILFGLSRILHGERGAADAAMLLIASEAGAESTFLAGGTISKEPLAAVAPKGGAGKS